MKKLFYLIIVFLILLVFTGCFPYVYYDQEKVLIQGIDIDQTLDIAVVELEEGGFDSILTIWTMRDQIVNEEQAKRISNIYFDYIDTDKVDSDFGVWHFAWAISNLYRNNEEPVKICLEDAYQDAKKRPGHIEDFRQIAEQHINGDKIYMGDVHDLGRAYARTHIVVPGNSDFIQSFEEYLENKSGKDDDKTRRKWEQIR